MTPSEPSSRGVHARPRAGESPHGGSRELWVGIDHATILSLELLSGILVWGGLGWLLDRWLGTASWFFGFGVMLGFGAGLYLVWVRTNQPSQPAEQAAESPPSTRKEAGT